jgi:hypothetical protein
MKDLLSSRDMPTWQTLEKQLINELVQRFGAGRAEQLGLKNPEWQYQDWAY